MFAIGSSLREARLRQGLSFLEVEQATKIRAKHLKALEEEDFDLLPAQTYVKGFLRTYAEYLGLDGQLYVDEYNSRYGTGEDEPAPIARSPVGSRPRRIESRLVLFVLLGIAVVTGLVIAAWKSGGPKQSNTPVPNAAATSATTTTQRPGHARTPTHKPAAPKRVKLVLHATQGASWIEAHAGATSSGYQLYQGTLQTGQTLLLPGGGLKLRRIWLDVGQPANLTWTLNGKDHPAPGTQTAIYVVTPKAISQPNATSTTSG